MQCSAFVAGMLQSRLARRVLVVAPKTLLLHWAKELAVCGLGARTHNYYTASESERAQVRRATRRYGGVSDVCKKDARFLPLALVKDLLGHHCKTRCRPSAL